MIIIVSFIIQLIGFYLLYNTSKRAVFNRGIINNYLVKNSIVAKVSGVLLLILSTIIFVIEIGFGTGLLFTLTSLMTISGMVIILFPLNGLNKSLK